MEIKQFKERIKSIQDVEVKHDDNFDLIITKGSVFLARVFFDRSKFFEVYEAVKYMIVEEYQCLMNALPDIASTPGVDRFDEKLFLYKSPFNNQFFNKKTKTFDSTNPLANYAGFPEEYVFTQEQLNKLDELYTLGGSEVMNIQLINIDRYRTARRVKK